MKMIKYIVIAFIGFSAAAHASEERCRGWGTFAEGFANLKEKGLTFIDANKHATDFKTPAQRNIAKQLVNMIYNTNTLAGMTAKEVNTLIWFTCSDNEWYR